MQKIVSMHMNNNMINPIIFFILIIQLYQLNNDFQ